jgi:hypothetical protein
MSQLPAVTERKDVVPDKGRAPACVFFTQAALYPVRGNVSKRRKKRTLDTLAASLRQQSGPCALQCANPPAAGTPHLPPIATGFPTLDQAVKLGGFPEARSASAWVGTASPANPPRAHPSPTHFLKVSDRLVIVTRYHGFHTVIGRGICRCCEPWFISFET